MSVVPAVRNETPPLQEAAQLEKRDFRLVHYAGERGIMLFGDYLYLVGPGMAVPDGRAILSFGNGGWELSAQEQASQAYLL